MLLVRPRDHRIPGTDFVSRLRLAFIACAIAPFLVPQGEALQVLPQRFSEQRRPIQPMSACGTISGAEQRLVEHDLDGLHTVDFYPQHIPQSNWMWERRLFRGAVVVSARLMPRFGCSKRQRSITRVEILHAASCIIPLPSLHPVSLACGARLGTAALLVSYAEARRRFGEGGAYEIRSLLKAAGMGSCRARCRG